MADNVIVRVPEQQFIRGEDGFDPVVTVEDIEHGHRVTITDREHPVEGQSFDVMDGASAYEQAVAGGYTGTEEEFAEDLAGFSEKAQATTNAAAAAAQSAQNAADSATAATTKAQEAAESAATALTRMNSANSSAQAAADSATSADNSANAAASSASAANDSAASASASESNAANSATNAAASETAAAASESAAAASATAAGNSAAAAAQSASAIGEYEHDAEAWAIGKRGGTDVESTDETYHNNSKYYAVQAAADASTASSAASGASQSEQNAASSASAAAQSATDAAASKNTAVASASTAEGHATNAASSATAASGSATAAANSATAAGDAKTAAETAQGKAEDAQEAAETAQGAAETAAQSVSQSAAQISQNASDISDLKSAINTLQPAATAQDVGKALIVKTVDPTTGKPSSYKYGAAGGGSDRWQEIETINIAADTKILRRVYSTGYKALLIITDFPNTQFTDWGSLLFFCGTGLNSSPQLFNTNETYNYIYASIENGMPSVITAMFKKVASEEIQYNSGVSNFVFGNGYPFYGFRWVHSTAGFPEGGTITVYGNAVQ